ncbi:hypothetical protein G6F60_015029 [Rhizopus arrhizus]|nr:hypothetical protein G6F60_015029 [Rhizopus arrhizus]
MSCTAKARSAAGAGPGAGSARSISASTSSRLSSRWSARWRAITVFIAMRSRYPAARRLPAPPSPACAPGAASARRRPPEGGPSGQLHQP